MSKSLWHDVEAGEDIPNLVNVIIEIPKWSMNKYEYDKKNDIIKLDRVLSSPFHYPRDYGFIPRTLSEDNDPLDALVLVTNPTYPGILVETRPVGVLQMEDNGELDNKIICVTKNDPRYNETFDLKDIGEHYLTEISHFFNRYKDLEHKTVEIIGWKDNKVAKKIIIESMERYNEIFEK